MLISEFFPNPVGKDTDGEWIRLFNNADDAVNLGGWQIKDASGKTFSFKPAAINPGEYLTLDYKTTKISLNNDAETLFLYDANNNLIDKAEYVGSAAEGRSLIRQNNGQFVFSGQTAMGETGVAAIQDAAIIIKNTDSISLLNKTKFDLNNLFIGFSLALILAFVFVTIIKKLNLLSE